MRLAPTGFVQRGQRLRPPTVHANRAPPMNFWIFLVGFLVVIAGVAWGLSVAGVPQTYILIACVIMLGIGILTAVTRTRQKDPPA